MMKRITHYDLCLRATKLLRNNGFPVVFNDGFRAVSGYGEQPDAIGFRNCCSCIIEVKVSRSDFKADAKKRFRIEPQKGLGDWRFYLAPEGMIKVDELPDGWGLLEVKGKIIKKTHGFPPNTAWLSQKPFAGNKAAECDYLYSALRRLHKSVIPELINKEQQ